MSNEQPAAGLPSIADRLYPSTAAPGVARYLPPAAAPVAAPAPSMADRLYPGPNAATESKPSTQTVDAAAERMYPTPAPLKAEALTPAVAALRTEPARRMYDPIKTYQSAGVASLFAGETNARDQVSALSNVFADHDATPDEASSIVSLIRGIRAEPPTDVVVDAWGRDAMAQVNNRYGDRAQALLADARRLVARDPRVAKYLNDSGLGNHPRVISMVIEKAASLRNAGRFK